MLRTSALFCTLLAAALPLGAAHAKEVVVNMRNTSPAGGMAFDPPFVRADPGDVIHFVPADLGHNAETIPDMLPKGTAPFKGLVNRDVSFTAGKAGLYGIKCTPHFYMGMVALVVVGTPKLADFAAAEAVALPGYAGKKMKALIAQAK